MNTILELLRLMDMIASPVTKNNFVVGLPIIPLNTRQYGYRWHTATSVLHGYLCQRALIVTGHLHFQNWDEFEPAAYPLAYPLTGHVATQKLLSPHLDVHSLQCWSTGLIPRKPLEGWASELYRLIQTQVQHRDVDLVQIKHQRHEWYPKLAAVEEDLATFQLMQLKLLFNTKCLDQHLKALFWDARTDGDAFPASALAVVLGRPPVPHMFQHVNATRAFTLPLRKLLDLQQLAQVSPSKKQRRKLLRRIARRMFRWIFRSVKPRVARTRRQPVPALHPVPVGVHTTFQTSAP